MEPNDYNLNDESNLPSGHDDKSSFDLPADYFSSFENKLRKKIESQEELKEFPFLLSVSKNNLFSVPVDYFAEVEKTLESTAELSIYAKLQSIKPIVPTELEADYIKHLQSCIQYKVELTEELKSYEILYSIDKENPFVVSETYFETFAEHIKDKIFATKGTKESVLDSVLDFIFGKKTTLAFGIITVICLAVYFYKSTEKPLEIGDCKTLACLERQEILNNNKVISNFDDDQLIDLVDVKSLDKQLNSKKETKVSTEQLNMDSVSEQDILDEL
ncbi:MAG: hypothetical protein H7141_10200 [Burkholderiales bacterium]|nr:hypothetical protein [Bacteroidia bacterium]